MEIVCLFSMMVLKGVAGQLPILFSIKNSYVQAEFTIVVE